MLKKLIVVAAVLALSAMPAYSADIAEVFEGLTNPHIVVAYSYLQEDPGPGVARGSVLLTANILGPKMGSFPCYLGGVGVDIRTLDPAFEDAIGAGWSVPLVTCAPWSEQVVLQVGTSSDFSNVPELGNNRGYYAGIGVAWNSPATLKAKRIQRQRAKEQKALLKLQEEAQRVARQPLPGELRGEPTIVTTPGSAVFCYDKLDSGFLQVKPCEDESQ